MTWKDAGMPPGQQVHKGYQFSSDSIRSYSLKTQAARLFLTLMPAASPGLFYSHFWDSRICSSCPQHLKNTHTLAYDQKTLQRIQMQKEKHENSHGVFYRLSFGVLSGDFHKHDWLMENLIKIWLDKNKCLWPNADRLGVETQQDLVPSAFFVASPCSLPPSNIGSRAPLEWCKGSLILGQVG